jgi:hypothetical protein
VAKSIFALSRASPDNFAPGFDSANISCRSRLQS